MSGESTTWRVSLTVPLPVVDAFEASLEPFCVAVSRFLVEGDTRWRVEGDCVTAPDPQEIVRALSYAAAIVDLEMPEFTCFPVPGRDWLAENRRAFPPLSVGRYFIHGTHFEGRPPSGRTVIILDAGAAFGSGEHASTSGCLRAMDFLARKRRPRSVLDVGCGSGILAIAAAKTWRSRVVAVDNDPVAVRVARDNAVLNRVAERILVGLGDGYAAPAVRTRHGYDVVLSNILARPLRKMAWQLRRHLAPRGVAVLSGFIDRDWRAVLSAHEAAGLRLVGRIRCQGWSTIVVRR